MKSFIQHIKEKVEFETLWSGVLGFVAVIAAVVEMVLGGIDAVSIAGAVKDIAGTLAVIMVLLVTIKQLVHKEPKNFDEVFSSEMETVSGKYFPLIKKQDDGKHRYFMASKLSAINDNTPGAYHKFFDLTKANELEISISKTVFVGTGGSDELFKAVKGKIVSNFERKCAHFGIIRKCESSAAGMKIIFSEELSTDSHAKELATIIDCILLTFVAEYKRT